MSLLEFSILYVAFGVVFTALGYAWGWDDCKRKVLPPRANNGQFMKRDDL